MSPRTVERVDDWDTVPFGGGYSGLRDLASQEFSGVVTAGPTRLFMIRGTVVGVLDGSIDDFEGASGTAREAPHPALPLLAVMQERSDEVRAKYYTEDTPIADVDRTLADGSFTGYVELSENVLSGDYYQVYHQGRSMSVAYVGTSERLITDDEAFDQANDEVGIYEVRPVAIDAIDIPEPADEAGADATGGSADAAPSRGEDAPTQAAEEPAASETDSVDIPSATASSESGDADADEPAPTSATADAGTSDVAGTNAAESDGTGSDAGGSGTRRRNATTSDREETVRSDPDDQPDDSDRGTPDATASSSDDPSTSSRPTGRDDSGSSAEQGARSGDEAAGDTHPGADVSSASSASAETSPSTQRAETSNENQSSSADAGSSPATGGTERARADERAAGNGDSTQAASGGQANRSQPSSAASGAGAADLEVRSIPSLDPARTSVASKATAKRSQGSSSGGGAQPSQSQRTQRAKQGQQPTSDQSTQRSGDASTQPTRQDSSSQQSGQARRSTAEQQADGAETAQSSASGSESADVADELAAREQEIEDLRTDLERVEAERDELETKATELESERDRLETELEEAQAEIDRLTERLDDFAAEGETAGTQLSASEAIDNTNLFVRYRSKGDATLETAHSGNADRSAVEENMRLEYHTQFDADDAAVGNEPFDDFLRDTIQYRFVDWLIRSLLYEVRDTGHADGMADLYNALPKIDRAELNGQVSVNYSEDGEEHRSQERFDVVVRDRMGNPLVVANINNSRDPATDAMMTDLIKRAERVGESSDTLAGAFLVTESFFEPEALETAEGATSSGLFSRDKRKSFVNLSRKGGYHLCLVEARNQEFHLAVPEL